MIVDYGCQWTRTSIANLRHKQYQVSVIMHYNQKKKHTQEEEKNPQ